MHIHFDFYQAYLRYCAYRANKGSMCFAVYVGMMSIIIFFNHFLKLLWIVIRFEIQGFLYSDIKWLSDFIFMKMIITEQDLPCIGASIFDADTYASSKPTSLGWLPASLEGEPTIWIRSRRRGQDFLHRFCIWFFFFYCSLQFLLTENWCYQTTWGHIPLLCAKLEP